MNGINFGILHPMIPYVRMTNKGKYLSPRAARYLQSQSELKDKLMDVIKYEYDHGERTLYTHEVNAKVDGRSIPIELMLPIPAQTPFSAEINFYFSPSKEYHYCDLDNLVKAVMDAGNKVVYGDDRWCDSITASRIQLDQPKSKNKHDVFVEAEFTWL